MDSCPLPRDTAHEFNNAFAVIRGHSELLRDLLENDRALLHVEAITCATERAIKLVQDLRQG